MFRTVPRITYRIAGMVLPQAKAGACSPLAGNDCGCHCESVCSNGVCQPICWHRYVNCAGHCVAYAAC